MSATEHPPEVEVRLVDAEKGSATGAEGAKRFAPGRKLSEDGGRVGLSDKAPPGDAARGDRIADGESEVSRAALHRRGRCATSHRGTGTPAAGAGRVGAPRR